MSNETAALNMKQHCLYNIHTVPYVLQALILYVMGYYGYLYETSGVWVAVTLMLFVVTGSYYLLPFAEGRRWREQQLSSQGVIFPLLRYVVVYALGAFSLLPIIFVLGHSTFAFLV
ncbi:MAG: hypothetical protein HRU15_13970, partial [Planctomycetes bacterium]|nr:hypothetical protein [Planctomycetota bacterium]